MHRLATPADEAAIRACSEAAYALYIPRIGRRPAPMDADFAAQIGNGWVWVADDPDGALLGYIVFFPESTHMLLEAVAVHPDAAGRGVGRMLMELCEDRARQAGLHAVRLYTNAAMTENLSLYPHLGYVETGRRSEAGFHRVYFEKRLRIAEGAR